MKRMLTMLLVVPTLLLVPASLAVAAPWSLATAAVQDDGVNEMARGSVTKIDASAKSFDIKTEAEGAKAVTVTWNDATIFMLNGEVVKWDEVVKENANLTVTHKKGVASKVEGMNKH